ncbi:hypothetical protein ACOT81_18275 [Streptomyces sp. WI04-05B]|uniref:hypothetical protein n=1 Tax=Streptomyces TaxID=1883 RepID=UPI0029BA7957|nr:MULTISPECIES: hypothetical protein [unclassified Streptomyces]MDX2542667.1 hypothetical protein [Streptomyces sp. WI04-05B]MDX2582314.1 hypothetical protein [Streptomyces sp. WI04-05A]
MTYESKANGVDREASRVRHDHVIDWLDQSEDLAHLIARVTELVLRQGYDPEDLVVMPRAELDRRELTAYSAGWADVVSEQLPGIRHEYEVRITAAYLQGQEDARIGRRSRRPGPAKRPDGERDGEVIPLPYVQLLEPPPAVTGVEQRGERERAVADGGADASPDPEPDILLSAREVRERRAAPDRRKVVRRKGRPSVPPLDDGPAGGSPGPDQEAAPEVTPDPPEPA